MTVKLFGDSHLVAVKHAAAHTGWSIDWTAGQFVPQLRFEEKGDGLHVVVPGPDSERQIDITLSPGDLCYFSGPFHTSRLARYPAWLTYRPSTLPNGGDALLVAPDEIAAHVDAYFQSGFEMLAAAKRLGLSMRVIEAPRLLARVADYWRGDLAVVAEVDRLIRDHVLARIKAIGLPVMPTPTHTYEGTWTKPEFSARGARDVHHGNRRYGAIIVRRIEAHLQKLSEEAS